MLAALVDLNDMGQYLPSALLLVAVYVLIARPIDRSGGHQRFRI